MSEENEEFDENQEPDPERSPITDTILDAFFEFYVPAEAGEPEAEQRTTLDIMEEMENIDTIQKWAISNSLIEHGFKIVYTSAGPFWLLKPRS